MNRQEKFELVESLKSSMQKSEASFLVEYKGLDVASMMSLRNTIREHGGSFKVAKVTLIRKALDEVPACEGLRNLLHDQIALIFSTHESPTVAKLLYTFSKKNAALQIKGGCFESRVLSADAVKALAMLPSREELLAHVCGTIQAPAAQLVHAIKGVVMQLAWVLEEIEKQKSA